ncbi:MAG: hypothetical protein HDR72_07150 [Ruminococcaceae bacterium]|nr:hypothetical protein [Oscillospiraceae bacterium]
MNIYTVSFFGHREISNPLDVDKALVEEISSLIRSKDYVEFLVGRNGDFDIMVASAVRRAQEGLDYGNSSLVLVLPYMTKEYRENTAAFEKYYNEIEICQQSADGHFKGAFQVRNRIMVDRSDLIICCIEHDSGGAYQTIQYAKKKNKTVKNLSTPI